MIDFVTANGSDDDCANLDALIQLVGMEAFAATLPVEPFARRA